MRPSSSSAAIAIARISFSVSSLNFFSIFLFLVPILEFCPLPSAFPPTLWPPDLQRSGVVLLWLGFRASFQGKNRTKRAVSSSTHLAPAFPLPPIDEDQ